MRTREVVNVRIGDLVVPVMTRQASPRDAIILFPSVGEYPVYDDRMFGAFVDCPVRNAAYSDAVKTLAPGRVALDIGTGRDALWAIECARAGAVRVYAIEEIPQVAEQARNAVSDAGLGDVITVLTGASPEVALPERAELCVSEVIGNIASAEGAAAVLTDARRRLCVPGAVFIPDRCATMIAAASLGTSPEQQGLAILPESLPYLRRVFASAGHPFDIRLCLAGAPADLLISDACEVERLAFNAALSLESTAAGHLTITRDAPLHGFLLWINLYCLPDDKPYDSLTLPDPSWVPVYAPLSAPGIEVAAGDELRFSFRTSLSDNGRHPDYTLRGTLTRQTGEAVDIEWQSPHHEPRFRATDAYRDLFPP